MLIVGALVLVMAATIGIGAFWASRVASTPTPPALQRALSGGARLGASERTFAASLGRPASVGGRMMGNLRTVGFARCPGDGSKADQLQVSFAAGTAISILYTPCGGTAQPAPTRFAQAVKFLPADASGQHPAEFITNLGGRAYMVRSPAMARAVDTMWFQDCSGHDVPPGTASFGMTAAGGWDLTAGTCPRQT
jgi:hypothetical protein